MNPEPLPIDEHLESICGQLQRAGALVLQAEPGAGKTTRVPAALLDRGVAGDGSVLVLEPRRVAARAAADFVARERGEAVGDSIGYRVRFDHRGGAATRVWFATEGVAVRRLASDPFLDDVSVIVLDEFHERHLASDVVLAIVRELRASVRPDLKVLVMSATLDTNRVAAFLGDCPVMRCSGRAHPVELRYVDRPRDQRIEDSVLAAVAMIDSSSTRGDTLVFLPGRGEIARCGDALRASAVGERFELQALHGDLPLEAQRRVLQPSPGQRRIILTTNLAESSVTVGGVDAAIDSGLARVPELDPGRGVERLRVRPISVASADQRAGRAGRQAPGLCIRLWSQHDHRSRRKLDVPEIRRLDLAAVVLELCAWGLRDFGAFEWLDPPPQAALDRALELCRDLGAITAAAELTETGRRMMRIPAAPRIARMMVEAERLGCVDEVAVFAALLSERDLLAAEARNRRGGSERSDLAALASLFTEAAAADFDRSACRAIGVDAGAARAIERARRQLLRATKSNRHADSAPEAPLRAVLEGFPDRVTRRRAAGEPRGLMVGRTGVRLAESSGVRDAELFIAVELHAGGGARHSESTVTIASALDESWIEDRFEHTRGIELDESSGCVVEVSRRVYRDLCVGEARRRVDDGRGDRLLADWIAADPTTRLQLDQSVQMLLNRVELTATHGGIDFPSAAELLRLAIDAACSGRNDAAEARRADFRALLTGNLTHQQLRLLERMAPATLRLPSGREASIDYGRPGAPVVSGRIQELFGMNESPRLCDGRVALAVEILGPNYRPVQLTDDLVSFWSSTYPQVRKELRGRYPKHDWPEDPTRATARSRPPRRAR